MPFQIMRPLETVVVDKSGYNIRASLLVKIEVSANPGVMVFEQTVSSEKNSEGMTNEEIKAFIRPDLKAKALAVIDAAIAEKARVAELADIQANLQTYVEAE